MNRACGFQVHTQAGQKTLTVRLFWQPGGILMSRRRISPWAAASRYRAIKSMCQFVWCSAGSTSGQAQSMNAGNERFSASAWSDTHSSSDASALFSKRAKRSASASESLVKVRSHLDRGVDFGVDFRVTAEQLRQAAFEPP